MLKKLDELRENINKPENQTAKSLAVLAAAAFGPRGTSQGLLDYQKEVDLKREKLQEKLDKRIATIQKLLLSRNEAMGKEKTYGEQMGILSYRLQGGDATRAEKFMNALANDPKQAQVVLDYIKEIEDSRSGAGFKLNANGILDAVSILETRAPELIENIKSSADIMEAILADKEVLADDKVYYQTLQDASVTQKPTGQTLLDYDPIGTFDEKRKKAQLEEFDKRRDSILNAAKNSGALKSITMDWGDGLQSLDADGITNFQKAVGLELASFGQLYQYPQIIIPIMKEILNDSESQNELEGFLTMNPSLTRTFIDAIPQASKDRLIENSSDPQQIREFDEVYGKGSAKFILDRRI